MQCEPIIAGKFIEKVIPYIDTARQQIDICVFDWRWYPNDPGAPAQKFNQAIVEAIKRGVKVRALVNNENVAANLRAVGAEVKRHVSSHLLHCKVMIIDDEVIITGSHNYTQSAMTANCELSVILSEGVDTSEFSKYFINLWQNQ